MSYVAQGISEDDFRSQILVLKEREVLAREKSVPKSTVWRDIGYFVGAVIPILTFLGVKEYLAWRSRKKLRKNPGEKKPLSCPKRRPNRPLKWRLTYRKRGRKGARSRSVSQAFPTRCEAMEWAKHYCGSRGCSRVSVTKI